MPPRNPKTGPKRRRIINIDLEIGQRVRVQRTLRKIKQTDLARAVGISFQQVQKYENGTNRISAGKLFKIAQHLNVPVAQFFEEIEADAFDDDEASSKSDYRELLAFAKSPVGQRVCRAFLKIHKKETQRSLLRMIETLSEEKR